jgi:hypothetical protein
MFLELIFWWYTRGWQKAWRTGWGWVVNVQRGFSTSVLLQTLFSPWKQIVTLADRTIQERFQAFIDNVISRGVGFSVRLLALLGALLLTLIMAIAAIVLIITWPLIPMAAIYFIVRAITG